TLQYRLSEFLSAQGYFEMITNSLTKGTYAEKSGFLNAADSVKIFNKLSEDLDVMRQTPLYNGLEVLARNINRRQTDLKYFEFATVYKKTAEGYSENRRLAIYLSGNVTAESWVAPARPVGFADLYAIVEGILGKLNIESSAVTVVENLPF